MEKSVFDKFQPDKEINQGIAFLLLEAMKIRRCILILNSHSDIAEDFLNRSWTEPLSGYKFIKKICKIRCSGIKKMFKEMPIIEGKDAYKKVMNYFVLCLTACKAVAETIYDRLINVYLVLQIITP